jgi:hypothetical protein
MDSFKVRAIICFQETKYQLSTIADILDMIILAIEHRHQLAILKHVPLRNCFQPQSIYNSILYTIAIERNQQYETDLYQIGK